VCGRFVATSSPELLAERFGVDEVRLGEAGEAVVPSWNVAPRAIVAAVRVRSRDGLRVLSGLRWGLVPSWAEGPAIGDRLINARAEGIAHTPSFRRAFARRRCLVPADGFYEWRRDPVPGRKTPVRVPFYVHAPDGDPLTFAGLWEIWRDPAVASDDDPDAWLRTCTIVTTSANSVVAPIHDRMPVLLRADDWDHWLDPAETDIGALEALLVPAPDDAVVAVPVSSRVNRADNDDPSLIEEVAPAPPPAAAPTIFDQ
jgi:putative SOS response-associated peptidase YedK